VRVRKRAAQQRFEALDGHGAMVLVRSYP
jgi:hypothetical protein